MKSLKILMVVIGLTVMTLHPVKAEVPALFEVSYTLYTNDLKVGLMERKITMLGNNKYLFHSVSKTTGLAAFFRKDRIIEQSKWSYTNEGFMPLSYQYEHTGGKKDRFVDITFNWDNKQIVNKVNDSTWHMDLETGILDKLLYQLTIMADLKNGKVPETYTIADGGKIKNYHFEHVGDEIIETPLGKLKAMKIERRKENTDRKTWLWCAYDMDFLPIKVVITEKEDRLITAKLKDFRKTPGQ